MQGIVQVFALGDATGQIREYDGIATVFVWMEHCGIDIFCHYLFLLMMFTGAGLSHSPAVRRIALAVYSLISRSMKLLTG